MSTYLINQLAQESGLTVQRIKRILRAQNLEPVEIPEEFAKRILEERDTYISLVDFTAAHASDRFKGNTVDVKKLLTRLENHDFYGVEMYGPSDLMTGDKKEILYFKRDKAPFLEQNLLDFFHMSSMTEEERIEHLLKQAKDRPHSVFYIRKYLDSVLYEKNPTPTITSFVQMVLILPDITMVTDNDLLKLLKMDMAAGAKTHLVRFLNFVRQFVPVKYSALTQKKKEARPIGAYSDDVYMSIATCIFNAEYIDKHQMIEKALDNHLYIEMWLYLSLFYTCGWRAQDVCKNWKYLHLDENPDLPVQIDTKTLKEDILYDRLPDTLYEEVCKYAITSVQLSGELPSKTAKHDPAPLAAFTTPELLPFYGLLTLIAEAVHLQTGEGYMKQSRTNDYQKKTNLRAFFGDEMSKVLQGENIQSRRLNKDFLQGMEEAARKNGCGSVMASAVASYARSHTNLDTIAHYLRDHKLHGESAEMVLYFMLQRGVFGFEAYQTLLTAFPDAMRSLPLKDQTRLISSMEASPYQIEMEQAGNAAISHVKKSFMDGDEQEVITLMKDMFEISQGRGMSKHEGVYCTLRARNEQCPHPAYTSCIAYGCPHLVFTRYGLMPLLEVLRDFKHNADAGDGKAAAVLRQFLFPRYKNILNTVMNEMNMNSQGRGGIKRLMEEVLYDQ